MSKNIKAIIWTTLAILALIVGVGTYESQKPRKPKPVPITKAVEKVTEQAPMVTSTEAPVIVSTSTASSTLTTQPAPIRKPKPKTPPTPSYGDMVTKYQGFRFQFDPECHAYPNQMATKNPVTIMLDNRSNTWQTIFVGTHNYGVAPYNYVIATVNETNLPMNVYISCNQLKNTAQIILQR